MDEKHWVWNLYWKVILGEISWTTTYAVVVIKFENPLLSVCLFLKDCCFKISWSSYQSRIEYKHLMLLNLTYTINKLVYVFIIFLIEKHDILQFYSIIFIYFCRSIPSLYQFMYFN